MQTFTSKTASNHGDKTSPAALRQGGSDDGGQVFASVQRADANSPLPATQGKTPGEFQRIFNRSPRVTAQAKLASALANRPVQRMCRACAEEEEPIQAKASNAVSAGGVIQRVVGPDEGRPGLWVTIIATGETGNIKGRLKNRSGEHIGYWVQTRVQVDDDPGVEPFRFAELDPMGGGQLQAQPPSVWSQKQNLPKFADEEYIVKPGDGVRFTQDNVNWNDGYCVAIHENSCQVYIADKLISDLVGYRTINVPLDQVETDDQIRGRLGKKKTQASKTEWSASELATPEQIREAQPLHSAISPFLLANPAFFGLVLRSGGFTGLEEFREVAESSGINVIASIGSRGKSKNKELDNAIVATDTSALLATRLDDLETGPGEWTIHGRAEEEDAEDHPKLTESQLAKAKELDLADFRSTYIFQQGSTGNEILNLPPKDKRTKLHAEAKAVRSLTWQHIVDETIREFSREEEESLVEEVSVKPETKRKIISIVINRSSCGSSKKGSGYGYGCAKELGDVITEFWDTLADHLGEERTARLRSEGLIQVEISVGGQYEFEGDLRYAANAGATTRLHPNYNYGLNSPEPLTKSRYNYIKTLAALSKGDPKATGELAKLLAQIRQQRKSTRTPVTSVHAPFGQADVSGFINPLHSGRIACTSIAACALEELLTTPGPPTNILDLRFILANGTDVDAEIRQSTFGGNGEKPSETLPTFGESSVKPVEDDSLVDSSLDSDEFLPPFGESSMKLLEDDLPEVPSTVTSANPLSILSGFAPTQPDSSVSIGKTIVGERSSFEDDDRYFAHDEVQDHFPAIEVHEDTLEDIGPQYLYGLRGDYRRIARQLTRMGPRNGLLVTIGGATIAVANLTPLVGNPVYALFDSHGQAIFETYDTEEGLTDAIEDLYPALPGLNDEVASAWYATPYRPAQ